MSLFEIVKEKTKRHHQSVEKVLVKELKELKSLDEYAGLLKRLYEFYVPIENDLHNLISNDVVKDISKRKHNSRLLQDIQSIDKHFNKTPNTRHLQIDNLSYALGVMYVIEGSTMGGQIISKMLEKNLPINDKDVTSYFNSYGDNSLEMWGNFKTQVLNAKSKVNSEEMINGAKATFTALEKWLLTS